MRSLLLSTLLAACGAAPHATTTPANAKTSESSAPLASVSHAKQTQEKQLSAAEKIEQNKEDARAAYEEGLKLNEGWKFYEGGLLLQKAIALYEESNMVDSEQYITAYHQLGVSYKGLEQWEDAEITFQHVLSVAEQNGDLERQAQEWNMLGLLSQEEGDHPLSVKRFQKSIAFDDKLGRADTDAIKRTHVHNLGLAYGNLGNHKKAAQMLERVLTADKAAEPTSLSTANTMHNLAGEYLDLKQYEKAQKLYESALRILEASVGREHPRIILTLNGLAETLDNRGQPEEALLLYKRSIDQSATTVNNANRRYALIEAGRIELDMGASEDAVKHLTAGLEILDAVNPTPNTDMRNTMMRLVRANIEIEDYDAAELYTNRSMNAIVLLDANAKEIKTDYDWLAEAWSVADPVRSKQLKADGKIAMKTRKAKPLTTIKSGLDISQN